MVEALLPHVFGDAVEPRVKFQVLEDRQILVKAEALRHVAQGVLHLLGMRCDIETRHMQTALRRLHEPADEPHESRLPRAVWPDECRDLPARYREIQAFQSHGGIVLAHKDLADAPGLNDARHLCVLRLPVAAMSLPCFCHLIISLLLHAPAAALIRQS